MLARAKTRDAALPPDLGQISPPGPFSAEAEAFLAAKTAVRYSGSHRLAVAALGPRRTVGSAAPNPGPIFRSPLAAKGHPWALKKPGCRTSPSIMRATRSSRSRSASARIRAIWEVCLRGRRLPSRYDPRSAFADDVRKVSEGVYLFAHETRQDLRNISNARVEVAHQMACLRAGSALPIPSASGLSRDDDAGCGGVPFELRFDMGKPRHNDSYEPVRHPRRGCARPYRNAAEHTREAERKSGGWGATRYKRRVTLRGNRSPYPDARQEASQRWRIRISRAWARRRVPPIPGAQSRDARRVRPLGSTHGR